MAKDTTTSTQEHLPIAGIQDSVIIMTDGSVRAVLKVEPINFELKSDQEQNAIIYSYQSFLNSLDFPIQIVIHSKKLDLENYLIKLDKSKANITEDLLRIQLEDYVDFVRRLISIANIMSKKFYVIVNYSSIGKSINPVGRLFHKAPTQALLYEDQFKRYREEVFNRANTIAAGLGRIGLKVSLMDTQHLIELFYNMYNPEIAAEERLTNLDDMSYGIISANDSEAEKSDETNKEPKESTQAES